MSGGDILILDVGKSNAKLSLWSRDGRRLGALMRANTDVETGAYRALDCDGVRAWLIASLREFVRRGDLSAIVPVAHGAAAALIAEGGLAAPPMSYENQLEIDPGYERAREPFALTGSPRLPSGLNLGAQLHALEKLAPEIWRGGARIVPYPQYWAWVLSGIAASEASSLGCHTDLWFPREGRFSNLTLRRKWAERFAPFKLAAAVLGPVSPEIAAETGLKRDCLVYCGAHDSNVALHGVCSHPALRGREVTVISTGTWFVAMRAAHAEFGALDESRDTLINVSVEGRPIPSARFMGGREMEVLIGAEDTPMRTPEFARDIAPAHMKQVLADGAMILPSYAPGVGPFPKGEGGWEGEALQGPERRAAAGIYLALVANVSLDLIGARDTIVVEGRFADDMCFLRMLAALRPDCDVFAARSEDGLALGALRLVHPALQSNVALTKIAPVDADISNYAQRWRTLADRACP